MQVPPDIKNQKRVRKGVLVAFSSMPEITDTDIYLVISDPKMKVYGSSEILVVDIASDTTQLPATPVNFLSVVS